MSQKPLYAKGRGSRAWIPNPPRLSATAFAGHSRFVRVAKIALPFLALVMIGIVIARLSHSPQQQILGVMPKSETTTPGQSEVVAAQYEGVDAGGRAYTLIAAKATRDPVNPSFILLEKPRGDMTLADNSWVAVEAASGAYDMEKLKLTLSGNVAVFHDKGYEMHLEKVAVDLAAKTAQAQVPVTAQGPLGKLTAANMTVAEGGNRIIFGGPILLVLHRLGADGKGQG